jgi:Ankyrin repeats (3 copies)
MPAHCSFVVIHAWPESVRQRVGHPWGPLPIHLVNDGTDSTVIEVLVHLFPEALRQTYGGGPGETENEYDESDYFPFFCAIRNGAHTEILLPLFVWRYEPQWAGGLPAVMGPDHPDFSDGVRALRVALRFNAPRVALEIIRVAWPASINERDGIGNDGGRSTFLHLAVARGASREVVEYLVQWRPAMVRERDDDGCLPIHYAGWHSDEAWRADPDAARVLVNEWPGSLLEANRDGELPVHRAVRSDSLSLVQALVELSPATLRARETSSSGRTPLHVAVARPDAPPEMVQYLVEQGPGALQMRDGNGLLPLELAAESDASLDVWFLCISKWPECVPNGAGGERA